MKVTVIPGSWAQKYVQREWLTVELPESATVADAITAARVPADAVGFAVISGSAVRKDHKLTDGAEVTLYPPIVGG